MKKLYYLIIIVTTLLILPNVYAKDTVFSLNKYKEEKLSFIKDSYNKDLKKDGNVVAGVFLKEEITKEDNSYNDNQIIVIKYKKNGKIAWKFIYGKNSDDKLYDFTYSYDDNGQIDGYLIVMPNTYQVVEDNDFEKEENPSKSPIFIKIDLEGNLIKEESLNLEDNSNVIKIIPSYNNDVIDGYIVLSNLDKSNYKITKYGIDFSKKLEKKYKLENELHNLDIIPHLVDSTLKGYLLLEEEVKEKKTTARIILINNNLDKEKNIIENIITTNNKLFLSSSGFALYGITDEVKLKKGDYTYYVKKYNNDYEEEWETLGNISLDKEKNISLKEELTNKFFILYTTVNSSIEVVEIKKEGTSLSKKKKITNDYYLVEDFNINKNTLFFIGQINCPEDDNCDYDKNSLFLISDEDKVIEVKEEDSNNAIIITIAVILIIIIIVLFRKRKTV